MEEPQEKSIFELMAETFADLPVEELAKLPVDGAENHDHYLYGWPKKIQGVMTMQEKSLLDYAREQSSAERSSDFVPIWKKIAEEMADMPDEMLAQLPKDGAENHDHYLYGWPKRGEEGEK